MSEEMEIKKSTPILINEKTKAKSPNRDTKGRVKLGVPITMKSDEQRGRRRKK